MSQQDQINALLARLQVVQTNVATIEANATANAQPPVDLTAITNEVTSLEGQVNQGLPAPVSPVPTSPAS